VGEAPQQNLKTFILRRKKKGGSERRPCDTRLGIGLTRSLPAARVGDQKLPGPCVHSAGLAMLGESRI